MKKGMMILIACCFAIMASGQGRHVNTVPRASAVTRNTNLLGLEDSGGTQTNTKLYGIAELVAYVGASGSVGLNDVLNNSAIATRGFALGAVTATVPYDQAVLWLNGADSSGSFLFQDTMGTHGIQGTTDGPAVLSVFGKGSRINCNHFGGNGSAPTVSTAAGAGTSGTVSISGNDLAGVVVVNTAGTMSNAAVVCTVTFYTAYTTAPTAVLLFGGTANAADNPGVYVPVNGDTNGITINDFTIKTGDDALVAGKTYKFYYLVIQ